jgi:gliding motility-associated-like protein
MKKILTHFLILACTVLSASVAKSQTWCTPTYSFGCTSGDFIQSFSTTGGSTNITNNNTGCVGTGYTFYSTMTHTGIQNTVVNWSFTNCPIWSEGYKIWVDWNNNGSFLDAGEQVYASATTITAGATQTGNFTIPITASPGTKRLRIRNAYATTTFDPCNLQSFGETEDYNLVVVAATPCSGQPTVGTASVTSTCPTTISLAGSTLQGNMTVQWQKQLTCGGAWSNIPGANSFSYSIGVQTSSTQYRAYLVCNNSGLADTSNVITLTAVTPCYCASSATTIYDEEIYSFKLNNVTVAYNCTTVAPGPGSVLNRYSNFTTLGPLTTLSPGGTYTFTIIEDECDGAPYYSNGIAMWIDWNGDGTFTEPTETVYKDASTVTGPRTVNGSFTVPLTVTTGINTGVRIMTAEGYAGSTLTPCISPGYGETEDYLVKIAYVPNATGGGVYCSGGTATLTASANVSNPHYVWRGPGINGPIIDTTASITLGPLTTAMSGTYYVYLVSYPCGGGAADTSAPKGVDVAVNQTPPKPIVSPLIVYCQYDVFDSIPVYGQNLKWYSVLTGGIGTTVKPIINTSVYGTVTYYVSQTVDGCEGPRATVTINVVPKPAPPQVVTPVRYCQGDSAAPLQAVGQNIRWYSVATGGVGTSITPTPGTNAQGTFTWYASQTVAGCESKRVPVVITVNYIPNALIQTPHTFVCQYDTMTVSYFGNATPTADYIWTFPNGANVLSGSGQGPLLVRFDSAGVRRIKLTVDNGGCVGPETFIDITVRPSPLGTIDIQPDACVGDIINVGLSYQTPGIDQYQWTFDQGGNIIYGSFDAGPYGISWSTAGDKVVKLIAGNDGCQSLPITDTIHVHALPDAKINVSSATICAGDTIQFSVPFEEGASYQWLPYQYFGAINSNNVYGVIDFSSTVKVHVTSDFNCRATDSIFMTAGPCCKVYLPTAFTPNFDGVNDLFRILTVGKDKDKAGTHKIQAFRVQNRWGQTVFETADERRGWDGMFNGKPQDMGTYYYLVRYKCQDGNDYEEKGELTLIR